MSFLLINMSINAKIETMEIISVSLPYVFSFILIVMGASLIWLLRRGIRGGRLFWLFVLIGVLWLLAAGSAFFKHWLLAILFSSTAVVVLSVVFTALLWHFLNQSAEIKRLRKVVEVRADRINALSHEIRTPLAMIKGASDLLLEGNPGPLTPQQATFLNTISQNCEHTILLAEDLLIQARLEAGLFKIRLEPVDLIQLVRQTVKNLEPLAAERRQLIKLDYPQVIERSYTDPRLIRQALTNLITNACRYTSIGGHIFVSLSDNEHGIILSVTDDGAGMSSEARQKLFQKFTSGRPLGDGTGLGLVIAKQIVELHGGLILVDTSLGRGTTILFTLPRWRAQLNG
jgi:signal transduction histidine kinase